MDLNIFIAIGFFLILIGIIILVVGAVLSAKGEVKGGFGGFIGPFVFGWASDPETLKWIIAITVIIAIVFMILLLKGI